MNNWKYDAHSDCWINLDKFFAFKVKPECLSNVKAGCQFEYCVTAIAESDGIADHIFFKDKDKDKCDMWLLNFMKWDK